MTGGPATRAAGCRGWSGVLRLPRRGNSAPVVAVVAERAAARQDAASPRCPAGGLGSTLPAVRMSLTRGSSVPPMHTAGHDPTTPPTRLCGLTSTLYVDT